MMNSAPAKKIAVPLLSDRGGKFPVKKRMILIPEMNRIAAHLFAATLRGFGLRARVLPTGEGLDLGKTYTSGKECYPCLATLGDILHFMKQEKDRLGDAFKAEDYAYFLPESDGPCRFGLYSRYQRLVLDSFPELRPLKIISLTTWDGYSMDGMLEKERALDLRKVGYVSLVVADVLDRLLWRIRPYEKESGMTDALIEKSMPRMEGAFEAHGAEKAFNRILRHLPEITKEAMTIMDPRIPRKPRIGIVGEVFVRMHAGSNQNLIHSLERHGAEVVNASLAEWVNYVSYDGLRHARKRAWLDLKQWRLGPLKTRLREMICFRLDLSYQQLRQKQVYSKIVPIIDVAEDHKIAHLENVLRKENLFSFDVNTETPLSVASILEAAESGVDGFVNVYPFTCMPSNTTSAVIRPTLAQRGIPYLDCPCEGTSQPGWEAAVRTFMYQAAEHFRLRVKNRQSWTGEKSGFKTAQPSLAT
jgi:predicted nucleotide-binding protein (sugar kinase/HSP70/actin superfamily)